MSIIADALRTMVNLKQKENESLQGYTKRFKTARDVLVAHLGGPIELMKYIKTMDGFDEMDPDLHFKCCQHLFILTTVMGQSMGP
jgi:hypothetical protein